MTSEWTTVTPDQLPADPFDLHARRLVVVTTVASIDDAGAVLLAAARGCAVAVTVELDEEAAEQFTDELLRLLPTRAPAPRHDLDSDQAALIAEIASGLTVHEAARRLGWSRRTATRRLADARRRLGVATTAETLPTGR
jgi:DNA-binding NarL/FixJ family response regulator